MFFEENQEMQRSPGKYIYLLKKLMLINADIIFYFMEIMKELYNEVGKYAHT